jgi:hypothetical protein
LAVGWMDKTCPRVARECVEHGALLLAAASVEQRLKLGMLMEEETLECNHRVFKLAATLGLAAVLRLQLQQLPAERTRFRLQRFDDGILVFESGFKLAVHVQSVRVAAAGTQLS